VTEAVGAIYRACQEKIMFGGTSLSYTKGKGLEGVLAESSKKGKRKGGYNAKRF